MRPTGKPHIFQCRGYEDSITSFSVYQRSLQLAKDACTTNCNHDLALNWLQSRNNTEPCTSFSSVGDAKQWVHPNLLESCYNEHLMCSVGHIASCTAAAYTIVVERVIFSLYNATSIFLHINKATIFSTYNPCHLFSLQTIETSQSAK